jgi:hypothetical protein
MVWEEISEEKFTNVFYQVSNETEVKKDCLTPRSANAFSPVVTPTNNGFLIAYLMETDNGIEMYIRRI